MINIQDITPYMKKGWVAMDRYGGWHWFEKEPSLCEELCMWFVYGTDYDFCPLHCFDIAPVDDWTKSLRKVGGK